MPVVPKDGVKTRAQAEAERSGEGAGEQRSTDRAGAGVGEQHGMERPDAGVGGQHGGMARPSEGVGGQHGDMLRLDESATGAGTASSGTAGVAPALGASDVALLLTAIQRQEAATKQQLEQQQEALQRQLHRQEKLLHDVFQQNLHLNKQIEVISSQQDQFSSELQFVKQDVKSVEKRVDMLDNDCADLRTDVAQLEKELVKIKVTGARSSFIETQGPRVKVPSYDGTTSWSAYRKQFELAAKASGWTDDQCLTALSTALRGPALSVLDAMPNDYSYANLMEAMETRYGERHLEHVFRAQLKDRVQKSSETLQQWALEIEKLVRKAYPSADTLTINNSILEAFVDGIKDLEVRTAVRLAHHKTMKEAVAHALEVEAVRREPRSGRLREVVEVVDQVKATGGARKFGPMCYRCGERGHIRINCRQRVEPQPNWRQLPGRSDRVETGNDQSRAEEPAQLTQGKRVIARTEGRVLADRKIAPEVVISQVCDGNSLHVEGQINGKGCILTLDTGATRTVVRPDILGSGNLRNPVRCRLLSATGQPIPVVGEASVVMRIGTGSFSHKVVVAEIMDDCIVGLDFMKENDCKIDCKTGVFLCGQEEVFMNGGPRGQVTAARRVTLPARSRTLVPVRLPRVNQGKNGRSVLVEDCGTLEHCITARSIACDTGFTAVEIANLSDRNVELKEGMVVGSCEEVSTLKQLTQIDARTSDDMSRAKDLLQGCKNLTYSQKRQAQALLARFMDIFSKDDGDIGRTSVVKHRIDTGSEPPIKQRARRVPIAKEKEVHDMIDEMRRNKIIEPSSSPWCSPVVLVRKKDGSTRFCIDYRRLNEITKKDSYPLPRIDDTLDTLAGSSWYSTLDLKSGYWQVELHPDDKEKTAFSTGQGLWHFNVMPFGLCNAPATFERLMECVLVGLIGDACLVYLDDVIVTGKDFQHHLQQLEKILVKIKSAGLKLNPKKCNFFQNKVNYLGHIISQDGVQTDPEKIEAVQKWPTPKDKTEVRAFLGLCSYYRRFVEGFADIAKPLHQLTEEKKSFHWSDSCNEAFERLKKKLCESPILGYPNRDGQFIVDTDASNSAIGGVLSQKQGDREVVIAYFSKALSRPEANYCVTRRELLAVVKTLRHFKKYLIGRPFLLRTDHAALKWLLQFKDPEGQVARWIEQLQEYEYTIEHRSGKSHMNADGLSRRPCAEDCKHCLRMETLDRVQVLRFKPTDEQWENEFRQAQNEDVDLKPVIDWKKRSESKPKWQEVAPFSSATKSYWAQWESLVLKDDLLYRKWEKPSGKDYHLQLIVPQMSVKKVLRELHDGVSGGHLGIRRTLVKIRERFYWLHLREDVEEWCRKCTKCAAVKGPHTRSRGKLRLYNVGMPWERIAVDIAGPFPKTEDGNKYFMVVMDYFTKWPEVFAIPNQEATTVAEKLVNEVVCRFGVPLEIHSDQGRNFESNLFQEICKLLGIHKTRTTPYHPQSDGMVERFNQTLERHLAKLVDDHQKDWDKYIPKFLLSYRSVEHESTKVTPAFANFGRELRLPADLLTGGPPEDDAEEQLSVPDYVDKLREMLREIHLTMRENGLAASERMKTRYDRNANHSGFSEGTLVWLHNPVRRKGKSPKLQRRWEGPYKVVTRINDVTYRIQRQPRGALKIVHVDRLARYHGSNDVRDEHL